MAETNYSVDTDLREARAMVDGLDTYVRRDELYGSVHGGVFVSPNTPHLTIGALLLRLRRLNALRDTLTPAQVAQLDSIIALHDQVHREWTVHYDAKMKREAASRLKMMNAYFEEIRDGSPYVEGAYQPEALRRTIVQDIRDRMREVRFSEQDISEIEGGMNMVDTRLHRITRPGDFIWSSQLAPAYPKQPYWWLHVRPPKDI